VHGCVAPFEVAAAGAEGDNWPMLKWISPLVARFKLAPRPRQFWAPAHAAANHDQATFGQKLAEGVAAFVGSWTFLSAQAAKRVRSVGEMDATQTGICGQGQGRFRGATHQSPTHVSLSHALHSLCRL